MSRKRTWFAFLFTVLVCASLTDCAAATAANGSNENEPRENAEAPSESSGSTDFPEPPGSTLSYGGQTVRAGLGSYCWRSGSGSVCTDSFGTPISGETLTLPAGSTMTFAYGGEKLDSLSVSAERIGPENHLERAGGGSFLVPDEWDSEYEKPTKLQASRSGNRADLIAELPAG